jgi:triacylglycerol lipase
MVFYPIVFSIYRLNTLLHIVTWRENMSSIENPGLHFATLAKVAYLTQAESKPGIHELGYTKSVLVDYKGAECLIVENSERVVLAFRGTEPKEFSDIKADLKAWKRPSDTEGMVHAGFYDYLERIWEHAEAYCSTPARKKKELYICGHSLGGAMATLAASRLSDRVVACYTYGSPRVGGRDWLAKQTFENHRYVNNNDVVPRVPFWIMGFRHYGELHYINYYGNLRKLTPWQKFKDSWRGRFRAWSKLELFDGARDHSMDAYEAKIAKN